MAKEEWVSCVKEFKIPMEKELIDVIETKRIPSKDEAPRVHSYLIIAKKIRWKCG